VEKLALFTLQLHLCMANSISKIKNRSMDANEILLQVKHDIDDIKRHIIQTSSAFTVSDKWIPRSKVMEFLNYGLLKWQRLKKMEKL
jgi:hypothetical protein